MGQQPTKKQPLAFDAKIFFVFSTQTTNNNREKIVDGGKVIELKKKKYEVHRGDIDVFGTTIVL